MDEMEQLKRLLKKNLEVSEETYKIIKKLYKAHKISRFIKIAYWIFIAAAVLGLYYYVQPVVDGLKETVNDIRSIFSPAGNADGAADNTEKILQPGVVDKIENFLKINQ